MESEEATLRRQARQREYYLKHREKLLAYSPGAQQKQIQSI